MTIYQTEAGLPHYSRKPKAATAAAARPPRPYCCPASTIAPAAELAVLVADAVALVPVAEAVLEAVAEAVEVVVPKVMLVESM